MPHSLADNLLNNPLGVIEELYSKHAVQDVLGFVDVVKDHFEEIIKESQLQVSIDRLFQTLKRSS